MKILKFAWLWLTLTVCTFAQQFDNPVKIPVKFYGESMSPTTSTTSFSFSPDGITFTSAYSRNPGTYTSSTQTAYLVPGKSYIVSVTSSSAPYVIARFLQVDGCAVYIDGNRSTSICKGAAYQFVLRVQQASISGPIATTPSTSVPGEAGTAKELGLDNVAASIYGTRGGQTSSFPEDKPTWYMSLGNLRCGDFAGVLGFSATGISNALGRTDSLSYNTFNSSEVALTTNAGAITEIVAPEVRVEVDSYDSVSTSYGIRLYKTGASSPYVKYKVSYLAVNGEYSIRIDRLEDGEQWTTQLTQGANRWVRKDWQRTATNVTQIDAGLELNAAGPTATVDVSGTGIALTKAVSYGDCGGSKTLTKVKVFIDVNSQPELSSVTLGGNGDPGLTTSYTYYTDNTGSNWSGALATVVEPTGNWVKYDYVTSGTGAGQVYHVYKPWINTPRLPADATTTNAYVETYQYGANFDAAQTAITSKIVSISNTVIGKTTWAYNWNAGSADSHNYYSKVQTAYANSSDSLITTTLAFRPDDPDRYFANRAHSISFPGGRKDSYAYFKGTWDRNGMSFTPSATGSDRLILTFHGESTSANNGILVNSYMLNSTTWNLDPVYMISNFSTVTETVVDSLAHQVFAAENIYTGSGSGMERISAIKSSYNDHNLKESEVDVIRSVGSVQVATTYAYTAGILTSHVAADGVRTSYAYNSFLQNSEVTTGDLTGVSNASAYANFPAKTQAYSYYACGLKYQAQDCSCTPSAHEYLYESNGRLASESEPKPSGGNGSLYTLIGYSSDSLTTTTTDPKNATKVSVLSLDGQTCSVGGTGQAPKSFTVSIDPNGYAIRTVINGSDQSNGWAETTTDWLGRPLYLRAPQVGWTTGSNKVVKKTSVYEAGSGRLHSVVTIDESTNTALLPTHYYGYGAMGTLIQEGDAVGGGEQLAESSSDRILKYSKIFFKDSASDGYNGWIMKELVQTLITSGSSALTTLSEKRTRLTRFNNGAASGGSVAVSDCVSINASGRWSVDWVWLNPSSLGRDWAHLDQGVSNYATKSWVNGYVEQEQVPMGRSMTYAYNSYGLLSSSTEAGTGVTRSITYYPGTKYIYQDNRSIGLGQIATDTYSYSWNSTARTQTIAVADKAGNTGYTEYNSLGLQVNTWGSGANPTHRIYDDNGLGRLQGLTTWLDNSSFTGATFPGTSGGSTVSWTPDSATGVLVKRNNPDGTWVKYQYNARGQVASRTANWDDASKPKADMVTTYSYYDSSPGLTGELKTVSYNSANGITTPDLAFSYKRMGAIDTVTQGSASEGRTHTFSYNSDMTPLSELYGSYFGGATLAYNYDSMGRPTGYSYSGAGTFSQSSTYDPAIGLVNSTTGSQGALSATFQLTYDSNTGILATVSSGMYARTLTLESQYDVIKTVNNSWNGVSYGKFTATFDSTRGLQETLASGESVVGSWSHKMDLGAGINQTFGYDAQGQLTSVANLYQNSSSQGSIDLALRNITWQFDAQGNRKSEAGASTTTYTPNGANQYSSITGAKAESVVSYDQSGNLAVDGSWTYTYDHENRLVKMVKSTQTLVFEYDYMGRRIRKVVTGEAPSVAKFVWAGWTLVAEVDNSASTPVRSYLWGPDISDARGSAGGAGALLAQFSEGKTYFSMSDQHGNIVGYMDGAGTIASAKEFGVHGQDVSPPGGSTQFPIGYSAKYTDSETGLVYFGLRFYQPKHGRFINRDPIGEAGGLNLYAFCSNRGVDGWDVLGLGDGDESGHCGDYGYGEFGWGYYAPSEPTWIPFDVNAYVNETTMHVDPTAPAPAPAVAGHSGTGGGSTGQIQTAPDNPPNNDKRCGGLYAKLAAATGLRERYESKFDKSGEYKGLESIFSLDADKTSLLAGIGAASAGFRADYLAGLMRKGVDLNYLGMTHYPSNGLATNVSKGLSIAGAGLDAYSFAKAISSHDTLGSISSGASLALDGIGYIPGVGQIASIGQIGVNSYIGYISLKADIAARNQTLQSAASAKGVIDSANKAISSISKEMNDLGCE